MNKRWVFCISTLTVGIYLFAVRLALEWEDILKSSWIQQGTLLYHQPAGSAGQQANAYQRIQRFSEHYNLEYGFLNFNDDSLSVRLRLDKELVEAARDSFGWSQEELNAIFAGYQREWNRTVQQARREYWSQAKLDVRLKILETEHTKKRLAYLASRNFKLLSGNVIGVDMPELARRNTQPLLPLARGFEQIGQEKGYDDEDLLGAVIAMVQTSLFYRIPHPRKVNEKPAACFLPCKL